MPSGDRMWCSGWWCPATCRGDGRPSTSSTAPRGAGGPRRTVSRWRTATWSRWPGRCAPVLPQRWGDGVAGGGGGEERPAHSSSSERMSTPDRAWAGRRWPSRAAAGVPATIWSHQVEVRGRHQQATPAARHVPQGLLDRVVVGDPSRRAAAAAGSSSSCSVSTAARPRGDPQLQPGPDVPSVSTRVLGPSAAIACSSVGRREGRERRRPPRRPRPARCAVRVRWIAPEEQRGVVLVDQHRQAAVGGGARLRRCSCRYAA